MRFSKIIAQDFDPFGHVSEEIKKDITAKYAAELADASSVQRFLIRLRIWGEVLNQSKPSRRDLRKLYSQRAFRK